MKKKMIVLLAACIAYAATSSVASAFMYDWKINLDGTGAGSATTINEYLDTAGNSYIKNTPTGGSSFSFQDYGFFRASGHDGSGAISATKEFTALFQGTGSGTYGGSIGFDPGGYLKFYSDATNNYGTSTGGGIYYGANDGTQFAQFKIRSGSATVDASAVPNGQITIIFEADNTFGTNGFLPGYAFTSAGKDFSLFAQPFELILGFATTNASLLNNPNATLRQELADFSGFSPIGTNLPNELVVSNNGQYRTAAVPEPGTLALLGIGFFGLAVFGKRKINK